jgi:hypothetical protein
MDTSGINTCFNCGAIIEPNKIHVCEIGGVESQKNFTLYSPLSDTFFSNQVLQKLDKIIELLEKLSDEDEDKLLLELEKKGFFQLLLDEKNLNSSS